MWTRDVYVPVKVEFPTEEVEKVNFLSNGYWSHCALVDRIDGDSHNVYCWGSDSEGVISHNFKQCRDDYEEKFSAYISPYNEFYNLFFAHPTESEFHELVVSDVSGTWSYNYKDWFVYNSSGDIRYPIYGQRVTNVRTYAKKESDTNQRPADDYYLFTHLREACFNASLCILKELIIEPSISYTQVVFEHLYYDDPERDLSNATFISLSEFDTKMNWLKEEQANVLKVSSLLGDTDLEIGYDGELAKIYPNIELATACYSYQNFDKVGCYTWGGGSQLLGNGCTRGSGYVKTDDSILTNVQDLSMNRHSVCAISLVTDDPYGSTKVYCWGSAFFGQMGYMPDIIDTDRAVSYDNVLSTDSFFLNRTKYYATPVNLWGN